jgi:hypothetical protein
MKVTSWIAWTRLYLTGRRLSGGSKTKTKAVAETFWTSQGRDEDEGPHRAGSARRRVRRMEPVARSLGEVLRYARNIGALFQFFFVFFLPRHFVQVIHVLFLSVAFGLETKVYSFSSSSSYMVSVRGSWF